MKIKKTTVCIIGSGFAGYNAQLFLQRAGIDNCLITGMAIGGQIMYTSEIDNYLPYRTTGPEFIKSCRTILQQHKAVEIIDYVIDISQKDGMHIVKCARHLIYAEYIIIATGARWKALGIRNEDRFIDQTIFTCVSCEADRIANKDIAIIGGGEKAVTDALYSVRIANTVSLIIRSNRFRYCGPLISKISTNSKISIYFNTELKEIDDAGRFKFVQNEQNLNLNVEFVILAIGHYPNTDSITGLPALNSNGYIITNEYLESTVDKIYAAGEVADERYKQLITSGSDGAKAAMEIIRRKMNDI